MSKKLFMKPLKALASPGIYLFGKYNQYKRERLQSNSPITPAENELSQLNIKIDKLLNKLNGKYVEVASTPEEECVICVNAKAVMQTYPCGHKVVCRRCFVKTIQIALAQRSLPLRCVICRAKILRLKHTHNCKLSSIPSLQYRSSIRRTSKRSSDIVTSSCSLERKSWSAVTKHSRSLPGINRNSLKCRSSVNRSHSAVVYRQSVNSIRKSYRSCSLSSCSSDKCRNMKFPEKEYEQINFLPSCSTKKLNNNQVTDIQKVPRNEKSTPVSVSRETLIKQFQRNFKEGQLSGRMTSERNKSFKSSSATPKRNSVAKELRNSQKLENKHSNADKKRIIENTMNQSNQKCVEKVPSKIKEKCSKKTPKLAKSEKKDKNKVEYSKNTKNTRKEKKGDKKSVKVK